MEGKSVSGFTIFRKLGEGGMAEVWYAENKIKKPAAIKILKDEFTKMPEVVKRFENEATTMVALSHTNIRQVYDYELVDNRPCIIMEYLDGADLKERLNKGENFSDADLQNYWNQCVDALNYTHKQGIVHRDIKPSNIFITSDNKVKILDFGIAKVMDNVTMTQTGARMGTLLYMSPEQVKDSKHIDFKTDVYSLAVTFYHLITGVAPYSSDTSSAFEIQTKIVTEELELSALPKHWHLFLLPYLHKNAQDRAELLHFSQNDTAISRNSSFREEETIIESVSLQEKEEKEKEEKPLENGDKQPEKPIDRKKKNKWLLPVVGIVAISLINLLIVLNMGGKNKSDSNENADANEQSIKLPEVHTEKATQIGTNTAKLGGNVSDDGNGDVSERGIVYSATSQDPTISNANISAGTGSGNFEVTLSDLNSDTKYYARAYAINEKGIAYGSEISFITKKEDEEAANQNEQESKKLKIGDNHAGGIIFYLDGTGQHGLVCAPYDQSTSAEWGCYKTDIGGTATHLGSGPYNTQKIVNTCSQSGIAARICSNLVLNDYSDWYLPSIDELNLMYKNLKQRDLGSFASGYYWSSTEYSGIYAWSKSFILGGQHDDFKDYTLYVRAVRAF